ncbi:unnamed protein product [Soboliphyme baturini]|uniref:Ras-associating domain-containing protein n=1 Tax=Soboliphyme baturini TaxID=241478 RepID=A0A183IEC5_9BILA|nr:unnamed protein product [Soboliphyme baturini]
MWHIFKGCWSFTQRRRKLHSKRSFSRTTNFRKIFGGAAKFESLGVYLATILYKDEKVLCTLDDQIPVIQVDDNIPGSFMSDFLWFFKVLDITFILFLSSLLSNFSSLSLRIKLMEAAVTMKMALGVEQLGSVHYLPLRFTSGVTIIWTPICKFMKKQMCTMQMNLLDYLNYYETVRTHLANGLYIGYVKLHTSVNHIDVVVPENLPSILPFVYIRENPHVSKEEWEWLHLLNSHGTNATKPTIAQLTFQWAVVSAAKILLNDLGVADTEIPVHRLYVMEVIEINEKISFILLLPSRAEICTAPGQEAVWENQRGRLNPVILLLVHLCTYHPEFISRCSRISIFLELFGSTIQQLQREVTTLCLLTMESETRDKVNEVLALQNRLEKLWQSSRWLSTVVATSRSKHLSSGLSLDVLFNYSVLQRVSKESNITGASLQRRVFSIRQRTSGRSKSSSCTKLDKPKVEFKVPSVKRHQSVLSLTTDPKEEQKESSITGILRVYAAYPCGLTKGTNVKLQVSSKTTSREIVNTVVKRLNKEVVARKLKSPIFEGSKLDSLCLVVVIGSRERCLRDDFHPLLLQNPWTKGKLLVRQRNDPLAALECGNEAEV